MENLYLNLGFKSDPFAFTNANDEKYLKHYFIEPQYFNSIKGDFANPNSCIVFAPRGGGKTAQRRMIEEWAIGKPILTVIYDRFEFKNEADFANIDLNYHLRNIIRETLLQFIIEISGKDQKIKNISKENKRILSVLCYHYLGNITGAEVKSTINKIKSTPQKIKEFWNQNIGILEPLINFIFKNFDIPVIDLPEKISDQERNLISSLKYQLELIYSLTQKLGFKAIYVLIDRIDETNFTINDFENTFALIKPLITDLDTLNIKGYSFKFFLWDKVKDFYIEFARPDRVKSFNITWPRNDLLSLLNKRVSVFSDNRISSFGEMTSEDISQIIDEIIISLAWESPRDLIRFCSRILDEHIKNQKNGEKIDLKSINSASLQFSQELIREHYAKDNLVKDLLKLKSEFFSAKELDDFFSEETDEEKSRIKLRLDKAGCVKKIGSVKWNLNDMHKTDVYYIVDPRLSRVIHSSLEIDYLFRRKKITCSNCQEMSLIDFQFYDLYEAKGIECWKCEKPLTQTVPSGTEIIGLEAYKRGLKRLIADGDIPSVLDNLVENLETDKILHIQILSISHKFNNVSRDYKSNSISYEEYEIRVGKLVYKILSIIDNLKKKD